MPSPSSPNNPPTAAERNQSIDILRGLSILAVVLLHINIRIPIGVALPKPLHRALFANGYYAVKVFFVISGFLITANILRRWSSLHNVNLKTFYKQRFARIAPCLLALLAILAALHSLAIKGFIIDPHKATLPQALFAALTFHINILEIRTGYLPANWDVLWSLSIEEVFYLIYPILCRFLPTRLLPLTALALILAGPFARTIWAGDNELAQDKGYFTGFDCIALGCLAAWLSKTRPLTPTLRPYLRWTGLALMTQIAIYPLMPNLKLWRYGLDVTVLALGTALFLTSLDPTNPTPPSRNPIAWLGRSSYEIYLTHSFVMIAGAQAYLSLQSTPATAPLWHLSLLTLSTLLGYLVMTYYSEPLNRLLRHG